MESLLPCGQAGIGIQDCTLPDQGWLGASASESASLAASVGGGIIEDLIGITTISRSITTATCLTAGCSSIANTSTPAEVDLIMAAAFMEEEREDLPVASTDS